MLEKLLAGKLCLFEKNVNFAEKKTKSQIKFVILHIEPNKQAV